MAVSTASVAINRARRILEDIGPNYRWRDVELLQLLSEGQLEIVKRRPDSTATLADTIPLTAITDVSATGTSLSIDNMFLDCLVDYIVGRANEKRATFADATKAVFHMNKFNASINL